MAFGPPPLQLASSLQTRSVAGRRTLPPSHLHGECLVPWIGPVVAHREGRARDVEPPLYEVRSSTSARVAPASAGWGYRPLGSPANDNLIQFVVDSVTADHRALAILCGPQIVFFFPASLFTSNPDFRCPQHAARLSEHPLCAESLEGRASEPVLVSGE